jgi:hypothetical protein
MADLAPETAETIEQYVGLLTGLCAGSGMSLRRLERRSRTLGLSRWLPSSTVSDVFRNPGRLAAMTDRREFVESILRCCDVTEIDGWLDALDRVAAGTPPGDAGRPRTVLGSRRVIAVAGLVVAGALATGVAWLATDRPDHPPAAAEPAGATCATGEAQDATVDASTLAGADAKREDPTLDFGYLHGSAWYAYRGGATYYWGRGRSDSRTGGVRLDWRVRQGPWHSCPALITGSGPADQYVRTPAIRKVVGGTDLVMRICLWADYPRHTEKCTAEL